MAAEQGADAERAGIVKPDHDEEHEHHRGAEAVKGCQQAYRERDIQLAHKGYGVVAQRVSVGDVELAYQARDEVDKGTENTYGEQAGVDR